MILPIELLIALVVWGTLVGVDLVSLPQMMIARPLVAGTIAGAILGDIPTGLKLGVVFELLQYDILPVGAVRYPEYGPATVAAVATAHAAPGGGVLGLGLGALVGLVTGLLGGLTINLLRRVNSRIVHAAAARLESGDPRALVRVHVGGLLRDGLRAALVTIVGLVLAWLARPLLAGALAVPSGRPALLLAAAIVAAALAAGAAGALRLVGTGAHLKWFAAGLGGGALGAVWGPGGPPLAGRCYGYSPSRARTTTSACSGWESGLRKSRSSETSATANTVLPLPAVHTFSTRIPTSSASPSARLPARNTRARRLIRSSGCGKRCAARSAPSAIVWFGLDGCPCCRV